MFQSMMEAFRSFFSGTENLFGIAGDRGVVTGLTWKAITDIYDDLYFGRIAAEGQYPGYDLSLENG